jgi:hypothetical protein
LSTRGDWCHQDIAFVDRPPSYRALERAARLPKDALAVAHLLLAVGAARAPATGLRLIGGLMPDDQGIERRYACGRSLRTLTGQDFGFDAKAWSAFLAKPAPFAGRLPYVYPAFSRDKYTW